MLVQGRHLGVTTDEQRRARWRGRRGEPRHGGRRGRRRRNGHRGNEAIAAPVHGLEAARRPDAVAQRLAQLANTVAEDPLAHRRPGPHRRKQGVFGHQLAGVRHQQAQHAEGFGGQGHGLRSAPQLLVGQIEPVIGKAKHGCGGHALLLRRRGPRWATAGSHRRLICE